MSQIRNPIYMPSGTRQQGSFAVISIAGNLLCLARFIKRLTWTYGQKWHCLQTYILGNRPVVMKPSWVPNIWSDAIWLSKLACHINDSWECCMNLVIATEERLTCFSCLWLEVLLHHNQKNLQKQFVRHTQGHHKFNKQTLWKADCWMFFVLS